MKPPAVKAAATVITSHLDVFITTFHTWERNEMLQGGCIMWKGVEKQPGIPRMEAMPKSVPSLGLILMILIGLCGCRKAAEKSYTIAVIPKGTTHEFWKSINAGAIKAQRELADKGAKVEVIWKGPLREDDRDQQIQVVENFMARHVSAIVLAPLDSQAMVRPFLK